MTILFTVLAAAALFAAIHRVAAPLALDDDWERDLPSCLEDLDLRLAAEESSGEDREGPFWCPDFNQKKIFL